MYLLLKSQMRQPSAYAAIKRLLTAKKQHVLLLKQSARFKEADRMNRRKWI